MTRIMCFCEDVTEDDIKSAIGFGARSMDDAKRVTRCGMGWCQGLYCEDSIRHTIALSSGQNEERIPHMRKRPPVRPVPLALFAILPEPSWKE